MERVTEETGDAEWNIENHPGRQTLESFDPLFGVWVNHLSELNIVLRAGYPLKTNDLSLLEWKCLAVIKMWRTNQEPRMDTDTRG